MPPLSRSIIATRDVLLDVNKAQRLAMFFDYILTWHQNRRPLSVEEETRIGTDTAYLVEQGVVRRAGLATGLRIEGIDLGLIGTDFAVPAQTLFRGPRLAGLSPLDQALRSIASNGNFNGAPITADLPGSVLASASAGPPCLEIAIHKVPLPPEGIPWESLVQFRKDSENIARLRALRVWLQKRASDASTSPQVIEDELETQLHEYRRYMELQHRKYGEGVLSTIIVSCIDVVRHVTHLNFGLALRTLLDVRERNIALAEAEMKAPGHEVSYIVRAADLKT